MSDADQQLARLLRHPLRQLLLFKYAERVTSPSDVADALGERLNLVSYHTNVLRRAGCIELVRTERRRGASEHFYRTVLTSEIDDAGWEQIPTRLRRALVRLTIDAGFREAGDALPRGGMDAATAHVSRSFLVLDGQGRTALAALLHETVAGALAIERASRKRESADTTPYELIVMGFERASRP
jgi:DNA-binding transcriptional ArsR family regulator